MGTVSPATTMLRTLYLHVSDCEVVCVEVLEVSVGLFIPQEVKHDLARLDRPATLGHLEFLCLWCAASAALVLAEGNATLLLTNIFEILLGCLKGHSLDRLGDFVRVFVVNAQVNTHGLAGLAWVGWLCGELHEFRRRKLCLNQSLQ